MLWLVTFPLGSIKSYLILYLLIPSLTCITSTPPKKLSTAVTIPQCCSVTTNILNSRRLVTLNAPHIPINVLKYLSKRCNASETTVIFGNTPQLLSLAISRCCYPFNAPETLHCLSVPPVEAFKPVEKPFGASHLRPASSCRTCSRYGAVDVWSSHIPVWWLLPLL